MNGLRKERGVTDYSQVFSLTCMYVQVLMNVCVAIDEYMYVYIRACGKN